MNTRPLTDARAVRAGSDPSPTAMSIMARGEGYEGYVVIDTIFQDRSAGGVRISHDLALDEVGELAHEMSLKYALFHLPRGGAKAGVRMSSDLDAGQRDRALEQFGHQLAPILRNGIYSPGMDMNCGPDQLRAIYRGAGIHLGEITDTSWFTAISVEHALQACVARLGIRDRKVVLAIEGFGSVARHLAERLDPSRYRIQAVATIEGARRSSDAYEPARLVQLRDRYGDGFVDHLEGEAVDRSAVLTADVDVVLPSSRTWVLTPELAKEVRARAVVPIANAPYTGNAVEILSKKGLICLPGYLSNVGGVLASSLFDQGVARGEVEALFASEYRASVDGILNVASRRARPVTEVSENLARAHVKERSKYVPRSVPQRIHDRFVRPRLPMSIRARSARSDFIERFRRLRDEIHRMEEAE